MSIMNADEQIRRLRAGAAVGLNLIAHRTQAVAVPRTPLEYGDLRSSLVVSPAQADDLAASVSSDSPYAVPQHERLDYHHDDGEAKFLESAALETGQDAEALMANAVRREMER